MKSKKFVATALVTVMMAGSLAACANSPYARNSAPSGGKTEVGTLLGALGGAVAGAQFGKGKGQLAAVAAGTLLGAALGNSIGQSLDQADLAYYNQTSQSALETGKTGQTVTWQNPDSGNSGTITPTRTYQSSGMYCREYTQTVRVGGKKQQAYGTACRQPDGSWQVQN